MTLLDGKIASATLLAQLTNQAASYYAEYGKKPHLAAILVGNDGGSETYVASKQRHCQDVGIDSTLIRLDAAITQADLIAAIQLVNQNPAIHGLIVQQPLPKHIDINTITAAIASAKDVDGFNTLSIGQLTKGQPGFIAATPLGIIKMLEIYNIPTEGKHCVIVGRSQIVGLPMAILMQRNAYPGNATVTLCHSKTINLSQHTLMADIIIMALGQPGYLKPDMVKDGAVVIDVGITRVPDTSRKSGFRIMGDVDFDGVAPKTSYITPVPGGVGLMTIAALLANTLLAFGQQVVDSKQ